jgi:hypothetical protein
MPSYEGATVHVDRNGDTHSIPDAEALTEKERELWVEFLVNIIGE